MKTHGIAGNGKSGKAGGSPALSGTSSPGPKTPGSARKALPTSRPGASANKKRKLAARGNDVDEDDDIKPEIKDEVKQEHQQESDGSYTINPKSGPPPQASAAAMPVNVTGDAYGGHDDANDEVVLISEVRRDNGELAVPVGYQQQQMLTPSQESFYGFVSPAAAQQHRPSQQAIAVTPMPIRYEHDTNYPPPQTIPLVPADMGGHWLHHPDPTFFWGDMARLETSPYHVGHHA